ncbi:MAG: hypothetical protein NZL88_10895, partial [Gaiellaceae bacterium]|nr:hypothetical protein [Gaiellaceae bacterium]
MTLARPHRAFFLIAGTSALAYLSLPRESAYYDRWYQLFPIAAVLATLVGIRLNKPRVTSPWYLVATSGLLAVAADALHAIDLERHHEVRFPAPADYV